MALRLRLVALLVLLVTSEMKGMSLDEILDFSAYLEETSLIDKPKIDGVSVEAAAPRPALHPALRPAHADVEVGSEEDDPASTDAWEQSGKFEGDLVLSARQRRLIVEDVAEGLSRNGLNDITKRWPNNELIYYIQKEHFSSGQVQAIQDGLEDIARSSCITFRPHKKGDQDAVVIVGNRRGCFSAVGYQSGYQVLNLSARHPLGRGCFRHGTVVHELLHSLGFYHMQSSPDRDDYIDVKWANIIEGAKHNFRKYNTFSVSDFGVPYDYDSVLHYSKRAFSINGQPTLVPKKGGAEIGQRTGMSNGDVKKLNKMYCDKDSDSSFDDVKETHKKAQLRKKTNNNKPFEGHGLGYYQGKSVIVKLPKLETLDITNEHNVEADPQANERTPARPTFVDHQKTSDDSDEVFIDISKLMADITNNQNKPNFIDFDGINGKSKESSSHYESQHPNQPVDRSIFKEYSGRSGSAILSDDNIYKGPSFFSNESVKRRKYPQKSTIAFKSNPIVSKGSSRERTTDDDYLYKDTFGKSNSFLSEDVTNNPNENYHYGKDPSHNTDGDYSGYSTHEKPAAGNTLKYAELADHSSLEATETSSEEIDLYGIPAVIRDWWSRRSQ